MSDSDSLIKSSTVGTRFQLTSVAAAAVLALLAPPGGGGVVAAVSRGGDDRLDLLQDGVEFAIGPPCNGNRGGRQSVSQGVQWEILTPCAKIVEYTTKDCPLCVKSR